MHQHLDPAHQGRGLGAILLRHALRVCDRERKPAYLEATSEASRRLYEREGFVAIGTIQVGSSPPVGAGSPHCGPVVRAGHNGAQLARALVTVRHRHGQPAGSAVSSFHLEKHDQINQGLAYGGF